MSDNQTQNTVDQAVAEGGAYEVLRKRLTDQGSRLNDIANDLNTRRLEEFGDSKMEIIGRMRIRSENNAVGRDIVQVGGLLLFGYNVFLGLKGTTSIKDVFGLYRLVETADGYDVNPVDHSETFLDDDIFVRDFNELYSYYKDARLIELLVRDSKLLAVFQVGLKLSDVKVFRWNIASTGEISYIDARGDRDIAPPPAFDFEWKVAGKDNEVSGRFPHINILDTVFVETTGGDLTVKVENNTESGQGIYSEPVDDRTQSLDDARFEYAKVGHLILMRVLPFREKVWRGLVYNTFTEKVVRIDAISQACVQLPEDHGIIFPGGYYLQNGEYRTFDAAMAGMDYKRSMRSPNGEDVMYIFYDQETGASALLVYNMVRRELQPPIFTHGYARLTDGSMVLFHAENDDPTRVHQMQVWRTPFSSDEYAAKAPPSTTDLGRVGNAELVRAISDVYDLARSIASDEVSAARYERLTVDTRKMFDVHHWVNDEVTGGLETLLHEISATSESVLDEFEKVQQIRRHSQTSLEESRTQHASLLGRLVPESWTTTQEFVDALNEIVALRGRLLSLREYRYIDIDAIDEMSESLAQAHEEVGSATGQFLSDPRALAPLEKKLGELDAEGQKASTTNELSKVISSLDEMSSDLDMLSELMASLKVDDATQRTQVVEALSSLYSRLNQAKARTTLRRKTLGSAEAVAQFGAQFTLFSQSVASALSMATTPERADEQLARLLVQLEELESQFGEHDQFLGDILTKREELLESFESHKQALLDDRQRKAQSISDAANRILEGLGRRTERFTNQDDLNAFFVGDALIQKLRDLVDRLRDLRDSVRADDIDSKVKAARDQAVRALRDRTELFEDGGNVIRLGPRHRFSVNTQDLDLTLLPRDEHLALHLTGTDYLEPLVNEKLDAFRPYWQVPLESESKDISRAEYLASQIFQSAIDGKEGLSLEKINEAALTDDALTKLVRDFASPRYRDGYEKGIHDHDATLILSQIISLYKTAGSLIYAPSDRALALDFWAHLTSEQRKQWEVRANSARLIDSFGPGNAMGSVFSEITDAIANSTLGPDRAFPFDASASEAARYLIDSVLEKGINLEISSQAERLSNALTSTVSGKDIFVRAREHMSSNPDASLAFVRQAMEALCSRSDLVDTQRFIAEAAVVFHFSEELEVSSRHAELVSSINGMLSQHERISQGKIEVAIDDIMGRYRHHVATFVPSYRQYHALRQEVLNQTRESMRLDEFKPKPLTSFVRNQLINQVYLPVIGDNLAKQMGTVGEDKRSDLMGLLMMISPPGYGKTTLMEYVASRLGLVFMKINGPALGHDVRSLDPAQAPDATSRQELEKLNLGLEMGSNVMLYVDDIQHTHPEFLQKFISLCDGTRRIEGVWKGQTKTYDMRGKKFCVVMAGNPYTESGEMFKIPDMLANRADIYNLGDVLGGLEDVFLMSYIENSLTSNPVLSPMATRDMRDVHKLVDKTMGKDVSTNDLSHPYSAAEINEIVNVLKRMISVRDIVYKVNQQYIASAAQDDKYRTEPAFKLQGSYRNMNKLAEKISPAMNEEELQQLIADHYLGESQLLTSGAEENLLKLAELRETMSEEQKDRWEQIKADFRRRNRLGGDETDVGVRVVSQLSDISEALRGMSQDGPSTSRDTTETNELETTRWQALTELVHAAMERSRSPAIPDPLEIKSSKDDQEAHLRLERQLDTLSQGIIAALDRPVRVQLSMDGTAPTPVVSGSSNPTPPPAKKSQAKGKRKPAEQTPNPEKDQASERVSTSDFENSEKSVPQDVAMPVQSLPNDLTANIPPVVVDSMVRALAAHQAPLLHALRDRLEDHAMLGRALALVMQRMSENPTQSDDGTVPEHVRQFNEMLRNLKFRYTGGG